MTHKGTILVLDDDRLVLATLSQGLMQAGYDVVDADNGDDAILLARKHRPDLALLDIRLERLSGFDVSAYLREYGHVPFMFLLPLADDETVAQTRAQGAVAYLVKPLEIGQVVTTLEAALAAIRAERLEAERMALPASDDAPISTSVAIAVGILMHRFSLGRKQALERLKRLAEPRTIEEHAERLIEAVELLASPAPPLG